MGQFNTIPPNPFPPSSENAGGGGGTPYVLPVASDEELGGVMIDGAGLAVNENGLLSVNAGDGLHTNVLGELCADGLAYSTDEHVVGTWIDGAPIYEKTISVTLGGASDTDRLLISNIAPTRAWIVDSDFVNNTGSEQLHFYLGARVNGVWTTGFLMNKSDGLYVRLNNNYAGVEGLSGYVTIRYVKPTV